MFEDLKKQVLSKLNFDELQELLDYVGEYVEDRQNTVAVVLNSRRKLTCDLYIPNDIEYDGIYKKNELIKKCEKIPTGHIVQLIKKINGPRLFNISSDNGINLNYYEGDDYNSFETIMQNSVEA